MISAFRVRQKVSECPLIQMFNLQSCIIDWIKKNCSFKDCQNRQMLLLQIDIGLEISCTSWLSLNCQIVEANRVMVAKKY